MPLWSLFANPSPVESDSLSSALENWRITVSSPSWWAIGDARKISHENIKNKPYCASQSPDNGCRCHIAQLPATQFIYIANGVATPVRARLRADKRITAATKSKGSTNRELPYQRRNSVSIKESGVLRRLAGNGLPLACSTAACRFRCWLKCCPVEGSAEAIIVKLGKTRLVRYQKLFTLHDFFEAKFSTRSLCFAQAA